MRVEHVRIDSDCVNKKSLKGFGLCHEDTESITDTKMPLQREHVQFAVLFLCVPIQYLAIELMGSSEVSRTYAISQLVSF